MGLRVLDQIKTDAPTPPNERQRAFADAVLSGEHRSVAAAFRSVYHPDTPTDSLTPRENKTVASAASRLWNSATIRAYVDASRAEAEAFKARRLAGERRAVLDRLWKIADHPDPDMVRTSDRISALKLIGVEAGMFSTKSIVEHTEQKPQSDAALLAEIESILISAGAAMDSVSAGDGEAESVEEKEVVELNEVEGESSGGDSEGRSEGNSEGNSDGNISRGSSDAVDPQP